VLDQGGAVKPITSGQRRVLRFMLAFYDANDQLPPLSAIAEHFGWESWNAAQTHVVQLAMRGYLERNAVGKWRFTEEARANSTAGDEPSQGTTDIPTNGTLQPTNGIV
jgi:SOS-response transcriptional repressor LexA